MSCSSDNRRRLLVLTLALVLILTAAGFALTAFRESIAANTQTERHLAEIHCLKLLLTNLKEAETGIRGFAQTSDDAFLPFVADAHDLLPSLLKQVAEIPGSDLSPPAQIGSLVDRITMLSERRMKFVTAKIAQRKQAETARAEILRFDRDQMAHIQSSVGSLVTAMESEVRVVNSKANAAVKRAKVLLLGAPAISAVIIVLVFCRMNREIHRRRLAETSLNHMNETLERRVAERSAAIHTETQRRAEIADTLNAVVEGSRLAIVEFDPARRVRRWNPAAAAMFGFGPFEAAGGPYPAIAEDDRPTLDAVFDRCSAGHAVLRKTMVQRRKDGKSINISLSAVALRNPAGALRGFAFLMEDVTERQAIELRARRTQRLQSLGELTGGIAHDFNNILNTIVMNLDLSLGPDGAGGKAREFVAAALRAALRGDDLTKRLLTFARERPLSAVPVDLKQSVTEFVALMRRTLGEEIILTFAPTDGLWPVQVDPSELEDAMTNIALNARDAMPHGGTLSIAARNVILGATPGERLPDSLPAGPYVEISFTDTGEGMSPEVLEHALDPFFTTKDRGTGLGLSMVYGFATGSGGHVELFSPPGDETAGKGTVVRMWLPRAPVEPAAKASDAALAPPCARGTETLLVVEDQQEVRDVLEKALRALGYQVLSAADGNEALNILDSDRHIDLMVSDIVMPGGISGTELAARARQRWPELAIVLATGFADALRTRSTELPDGVRVIAKPYRPAKIASAIRAALDSNALRPA